MYQKFYFVDTENIGKSFYSDLLLLDDTCKVFLFVGSSGKNLNLKFKGDELNLLFNCQSTIEIIECTVGTKNAMDFQICTYLGNCVEKFGNKLNYYILSKDNGYKPLVPFWKSRGVKIGLVKQITYINPKYIVGLDRYTYYISQLTDEQKDDIRIILHKNYCYQLSKTYTSLDWTNLTLSERAFVVMIYEKMLNLDIDIENKKPIIKKEERSVVCSSNIVSHSDSQCKISNLQPFSIFVGNIKCDNLVHKINKMITFSEDEKRDILYNKNELEKIYDIDSNKSYLLAYILYYANKKGIIDKYIDRFMRNEISLNIFPNNKYVSYLNINKWSFLNI